MALSFTRLSWLWFGGKAKDQLLTAEPGSLKLYSNKRDDDDDDDSDNDNENAKKPSSNPNRKAKRKWKSREERSKKEQDVVLVPLDGFCLSGSESDGSDWSIGWLEPHAPGFQSDTDNADDSFAVLVPCYRHDRQEFEQNSVEFLSGGVKNSPNGFSEGSREYMEKWLSSLHKF